jgi:gas vesicle protein
MEVIMHAREWAWLACFLAGGALGVGVGVLIAPASGGETRRRLARRLEDEKDDLLRKGRRAVEDVAERLEQKVETGRQKLGEVLAHRASGS